MRLFDTHAHYDADAVDADRLEVLASMPGQGVELILNPGCDLKSSQTAVELAERFPFVYAAVGVHPEECADWDAEHDIPALEALAQNPKVRAIGEIGLDYHWPDNPPRELQQQVFHAQLELADQITAARLAIWNQYREELSGLEQEGLIELPFVPEHCKHNGHMFYIKTKDMAERTALIDFLKKNDILAVFHYVPLHSAPAGLKFGRFHGEDRYTTKESERLLRLPLYYGLSEDQVSYISGKVKEFYGH